MRVNAELFETHRVLGCRYDELDAVTNALDSVTAEDVEAKAFYETRKAQLVTLTNELSDKLEEIKDNMKTQYAELTEEELIAQIIKYKQFKEGAIQFRERYNQFKRFFGTPQKIELPKLDLKEDKLDSKLIYDSYKNLINKNQARLNKNAKNIDKIAIVETYSVGDSVKTMFKELIKHSKFVFNKLFNNSNRDSKEVVTAFSGLLEMSRRSKVSTNQKELFGDIYVEKIKKQ